MWCFQLWIVIIFHVNKVIYIYRLTGYNLEMKSEESEIYNIEALVYEEK